MHENPLDKEKEDPEVEEAMEELFDAQLAKIVQERRSEMDAAIEVDIDTV